MSSATTGNSLPALDAPPVFGTPEHQAYYYDKIEKSMYRYIESCVEMFPDISMSRTWVSLGEDGQKAVVVKLRSAMEYGKAVVDIENQEDVDQLTMIFIGFHLADMAYDYGPELTERKNSKKAEPTNLLLKKAICKSRSNKQNQPSGLCS